jgi:hypothetical protein
MLPIWITEENLKAAEHNKFCMNWAKGKKKLKSWKQSLNGVDALNIRGVTDFIIRWLNEDL